MPHPLFRRVLSVAGTFGLVLFVVPAESVQADPRSGCTPSVEECKKDCDYNNAECIRNCPRGDKNCMNECNQEYGRCLKKCK